jgi:lipoprotein signal peptidase
MADRTYRWLLITLAVIGLSADQITKYGVFKWLYRGGEFSDSSRTGNEFDIVPGWFKIIAQFDTEAPLCDCGFSGLQTWSAPVMPRVNHGALFGIGQGHKGNANGAFAAVSVVAAVGIVVWGMRKNTAREKGLSAALGLILGGTVGNLYDRIVFGGVRDFLYFYKIEWPVFNVADCCLVIGAVLLLMQAVFVTPKSEQQPPSAEPVANEAPKA